MTLRHRFDSVSRNHIVRSVGVLVGGTAFAHAITVIALPIATRLYTPSDFSVLAVFASLLSLLSVSACLRFDVAIAIPEQDTEAVNLLALALGCTAAVAAITALGVSVVPADALAAFRHPGLGSWLWLLPFGILLAGGYSSLQMWFVRRKAFRSIASSRVAQSAAAAGSQLTLGWLHWTPLGLILGHLLNTGAGCLALGHRFVRQERSLLASISWSRMRAGFVAYDRFPKYSALEALGNVAAMQLPILVIAANAAGPEAGYLLLAMSAMQAPMGLIGNAIAQVYLSRAPDENREGRLDAFTSCIFGGLVRSGVGPLVFAGILAPAVFATVFGEDWRRAGVLVTWMTPWFIMQFLSVPISMALHVTGSQRAALALQTFGLVLRVGAVYVAASVARPFLSEAYALSGFVFYAVYLAIVMHVASARAKDLMREAGKGLPTILVWAAAGGCVLGLIGVLRPVLA